MRLSRAANKQVTFLQDCTFCSYSNMEMHFIHPTKTITCVGAVLADVGPCIGKKYESFMQGKCS